MVRREKSDILVDMLASIQEKGGKIKPTHLMYKANLSHRQLKSYLEELLENHLVEEVEEKTYKYFVISDDGLKFLEKMRQMKEFEKTFGL